MMDFIKNLFGGKKEPPKRSAIDNVITAPLSEAQLQSIKATASARFEPVQLIVASGQSVGRQRELNEDSLFTLASTIAGNSGNPPFGLFIIADGMGGHQYGEVASNTAIRSISGYVLNKFHGSFFAMPSVPLEESLQEILMGAIMDAQRRVLQEAPGSGTTATSALVVGQQLTIGHVGDSRAYAIYPDHRIELLTRDHSLVRRLEELGQITASEAAVHPQRNVLYRALGQGESLEPDIVTMPFPVGGYLMICSDGLWGVLSDDEISKIVLGAPDIQRACQELVAAANNAGGPDNISVIIARMLS